jgi:DNA-binding transcriptional ArsR family regulator
MAGNGDSETDRLLRALAHPMRREILREMPEDGTISPSEMAPRLEDSVSNVSYHFRSLDRSPVVELVEEVQVRGATQHFYRRTLKHDWVRKLLEEPEDYGDGGQLGGRDR